MRLSTAYLPPVSWCVHFWQAPVVELEAQEHYQKGSWRNRCEIAGPNGRQLLSIPLVKGKNSRMPIRDVRIAYDEPWQRSHWRSIVTAYGSSPYFDHYADALRPFYEKPQPFLFDFNLALMEFVLLGKMGWKGQLRLSETYHPAVVTDAPELKRYPQVFEEKFGFLPDLSVLDLLFCVGKYGGEILK